MNFMRRNRRLRYQILKGPSVAFPARHSAAGGALVLRAPLAVLAAARFFDLAAGGLAVTAGLRAGRLRRAVEPPPRAARASIRAAASSSVMVSGVLSPGRLALTPSWLT